MPGTPTCLRLCRKETAELPGFHTVSTISHCRWILKSPFGLLTQSWHEPGNGKLDGSYGSQGMCLSPPAPSTVAAIGNWGLVLREKHGKANEITSRRPLVLGWGLLSARQTGAWSLISLLQRADRCMALGKAFSCLGLGVSIP